MSEARWQDIKALFQAAVERPPSERAFFGCRRAWRRSVAT
jgi:hypothetical protein